MIPLPPKKRTWFVVRCQACGDLYFFSRPKRAFTWFAMPPGHGPGAPCDGRRLRLLHYRKRIQALKAAGKIRTGGRI
jgi:hypothetical protein